MSVRRRVVVLGGGPDGEREVSIRSATGIAEALRATGRYEVDLRIIERVSGEELRAMKGDVLFPYLHGPYGEGGPLQDVVERDGRPFVGSGARASRCAMDKVASKVVAMGEGVRTPPWWILNASDDECPAELPVVMKPVHEGSTIGLYVCRTRGEYRSAVEAVRRERGSGGGAMRSYVIEPKVGGERWARELTVGVLDGEALPVIEIVPKNGLYDYEAKYTRNDTGYVVNPRLPAGVEDEVKRATVRVFKAMGCRHIARADFMLDDGGRAWFLEVNTTPGFTDHSLVPKAAAAAGLPMGEVCARLVECAVRDGGGAR